MHRLFFLESVLHGHGAAKPRLLFPADGADARDLLLRALVARSVPDQEPFPPLRHDRRVLHERRLAPLERPRATGPERRERDEHGLPGGQRRARPPPPGADRHEPRGALRQRVHDALRVPLPLLARERRRYHEPLRERRALDRGGREAELREPASHGGGRVGGDLVLRLLTPRPADPRPHRDPRAVEQVHARAVLRRGELSGDVRGGGEEAVSGLRPGPEPGGPGGGLLRAADAEGDGGRRGRGGDGDERELVPHSPQAA